MRAVVISQNRARGFTNQPQGSNVIHLSRRKFYFVEPFRSVADTESEGIITEDGDQIITESGDSIFTES